MKDRQKIGLDEETSGKLDTLIECFQLVLEQIHVMHHTDIHMMRRQMKRELIEEIKMEKILHGPQET